MARFDMLSREGLADLAFFLSELQGMSEYLQTDGYGDLFSVIDSLEEMGILSRGTLSRLIENIHEVASAGEAIVEYIEITDWPDEE